MAESSEAQVDIREMWPNEAYNFTPWLAENLHKLGEAVGLSLEQEEQERQVGSFSLDILAKETNSGEVVAIENQLEWTDHGHLGQLLTYAAGCDARIAIWVAADFQYEHAEALHKLNNWAGSNIRFYGVKVKVVRSASGDFLKPELLRIVSPDGWDKASHPTYASTREPGNSAVSGLFPSGHISVTRIGLGLLGVSPSI